MQAGTADGASRGLPGLVTTVAHVQHRRCLFQGPRLTLTFGASIVLIWGGNALVIWQFRMARTQSIVSPARINSSLKCCASGEAYCHSIDDWMNLRARFMRRLSGSKSSGGIAFSQIAHGPQQNSNRWIGQSFIPVESWDSSWAGIPTRWFLAIARFPLNTLVVPKTYQGAGRNRAHPTEC